MRCALNSILLFSAISLVFVGCARQSSSEGQKRIAGIVFQEDQFFRLVQFGMRDAAAKNGIQLLEANSDNKLDKEIQLINTYISTGVDAIVISPLSHKASISALQRAREKGITVITYNNGLDSDIPAAFVESDQTALGRSTGKAAREYIEKKMGGKAKIAILAFLSITPEISMMRVGGFKEEISKLPGVTIVSEQDAWLPEMAVKRAGDILTANPDLQMFFAANEGGTIGAVMAVKNAGMAGKTVVFGTDSGEQIADFLLDNDNILQAVTSQQPFEIGATAVEFALKTLKGEPVEKSLSLPGILLTREDPDAVRAFKARLIALSR